MFGAEPLKFGNGNALGGGALDGVTLAGGVIMVGGITLGGGVCRFSASRCRRVWCFLPHL